MRCTDFIKIGKISTTHGVHGKIKIHTTANDLIQQITFSDIYVKKITYQKLDLIHIWKHKPNTYIATINNVESVQSANSYINLVVYYKKNALTLQENEFWIEDLIGTKVYNLKEKYIGKINNVLNFGASDIIEIIDVNKQCSMLPFSKEIFVKVDLKTDIVMLNTDLIP